MSSEGSRATSSADDAEEDEHVGIKVTSETEQFLISSRLRLVNSLIWWCYLSIVAKSTKSILDNIL